MYEISDGDVRMTGTCKFSNIDAINRPAILDGIQLLKNKPRGAWLLTRTYSNNKEYDKFRKRSPDPNVQSFRIIDDNLIQKNSGFIMFKDAKIVVFYSNDLAATPHQRICESSDERSIFAVRGTVEIERWLGTESIGRSRIECPAIIASYQLFMNGVDRVDQMRSTNPTKRAEKRIHMTIWTYLLDLCVHQAYCVYKVLLCNKKIADAEDMLEDDEDDDDSVVRRPIPFVEFKRRICEQMVGPFLKDRTRRLNSHNQTLSEQDEEGMHVGRQNEHILLENKYIKGDNRVSCHLCTLLGKGICRTHYGCMHCQKGFHVNCFALYHQRWALRQGSPSIIKIIDAMEEPQKNVSRKRNSEKISSIEDIKVIL